MKVVTNTNEKIVTEIRKKLKERDGLCPSKTDDTQENHCMCRDFLDGGLGECRCGLYIKTEM